MTLNPVPRRSNGQSAPAPRGRSPMRRPQPRRLGGACDQHPPRRARREFYNCELRTSDLHRVSGRVLLRLARSCGHASARALPQSSEKRPCRRPAPPPLTQSGPSIWRSGPDFVHFVGGGDHQSNQHDVHRSCFSALVGTSVLEGTAAVPSSNSAAYSWNEGNQSKSRRTTPSAKSRRGNVPVRSVRTEKYPDATWAVLIDEGAAMTALVART